MRFIHALGAAALVATLGTAGCATTADEDAVIVGGAPMLPTRDIVDNAASSADHTTLVAAIEAAGLVNAFKGSGPFTVLAPTDEAFDALPRGTVETLLEPANRRTLQSILNCHVIRGNVMADDLLGMISAEGGAHELETVGPCTLVARSLGGEVVITDENGTRATVTQADVVQSNGVIHVVDAVLQPRR